MQTAVGRSTQAPASNPGPTMYSILLAISLVHLFNDSIQSVITAISPILKDSMHLSYSQVGVIGLALNLTASVMQPVVGLYTDKKPSPYLLPAGMASTCLGMLGLALAPNFVLVLLSIVLVGFGSAVFHPEGSRVAFMAAGPRRGLAQSIFQVGGNAGQSLAPVLMVMVFLPFGQFGAIWFTLVAGLAILVQLYIASWYKTVLAARPLPVRSSGAAAAADRKKNNKRIAFAVALLVTLVFARSWYHAGISYYYPFYLMEKFGIPVEETQLHIFLFLAAGAVGTFLGGPLADRFGRRNMIFFSMLGSAPLALLLPYANLFWAYVILLVNGLILLSSFSVTVVYAQELIPGKIGTVTGLITGLAFGMGALGSAALGGMADWAGLHTVMLFCSVLPLLGLMTLFLPSDQELKERAADPS
jgi:FSR family fosmidomycin resistance protein-like MFS transporter